MNSVSVSHKLQKLTTPQPMEAVAAQSICWKFRQMAPWAHVPVAMLNLEVRANNTNKERLNFNPKRTHVHESTFNNSQERI